MGKATQRNAITQRLEEARTAAGMTITDWAEKLGVKRWTYYSWTTGHRAPNRDSIGGIASHCPELRDVLIGALITAGTSRT